MRMVVVKCDGKSLSKSLYQNFIICLRKWWREFNIWVSKNFIVLFEIFAFFCKVNLINQNLFQRFVVYRNLKPLWNFRKDFTEEKQKFDVSFNVLLHVGMSDFDSDFFTLKFGFVYLTDGARCNWFVIKFIEHLVNVDSVNTPEYFLSLFNGMSGRIVS